MPDIFKRLRLIQSCIELENLDFVELQVGEYKQHELNKKIQEILVSTGEGNYYLAMTQIRVYFERYNIADSCQDDDLLGLKKELEKFERCLQDKDFLSDCSSLDIGRLKRFYQTQLSNIILSILELEKKVLKREVREQKEIFEIVEKKYIAISREVKFAELKKTDIEKRISVLDQFEDQKYDELYERLKEVRLGIESLEEKKENIRKKAKKEKQKINEKDQCQERNGERQIHLCSTEKEDLKKIYRKVISLYGKEAVPEASSAKILARLEENNQKISNNLDVLKLKLKIIKQISRL